MKLKLENKMKKLSFIAVVLLSLNSYGRVKYRIAELTLTVQQIYGPSTPFKECSPGNDGIIFNYNLDPYTPGMSGASLRDKVFQIIGYTLSEDDLIRKTTACKNTSICSFSGTNPFKIDDIDSGRYIKTSYSLTKSLNINYDASIDADVNELMKINDAAKLADARAIIKAGYDRARSLSLTVDGFYSEWELSRNTINNLKYANNFEPSRKLIENLHRRIITAVGIVNFKINASNNVLDSLSIAVNAELQRKGITATASFNFKRKVIESYQSSSESFQIIAIRHAGMRDHDLVVRLPRRSIFTSFNLDTFLQDTHGKYCVTIGNFEIGNPATRYLPWWYFLKNNGYDGRIFKCQLKDIDNKDYIRIVIVDFKSANDAQHMKDFFTSIANDPATNLGFEPKSLSLDAFGSKLKRYQLDSEFFVKQD